MTTFTYILYATQFGWYITSKKKRHKKVLTHSSHLFQSVLFSWTRQDTFYSWYKFSHELNSRVGDISFLKHSNVMNITVKMCISINTNRYMHVWLCVYVLSHPLPFPSPWRLFSVFSRSYHHFISFCYFLKLLFLCIHLFFFSITSDTSHTEYRQKKVLCSTKIVLTDWKVQWKEI